MAQNGDDLVRGWARFERWARDIMFSYRRRFKPKGLLYLDELDIYTIVSNEQDTSILLDYDGAGSEKHLKDNIAFLRDYFVDISFDGEFLNRVEKTLRNHNSRRCHKGYGIFMSRCQDGEVPPPINLHFFGNYANLFCEELADIDFSSAVSILPFDQVALRNRGGKMWTDDEIGIAITEIENDLEFDGLQLGLKVNWQFEDIVDLYAANPWWKSV